MELPNFFFSFFSVLLSESELCQLSATVSKILTPGFRARPLRSRPAPRPCSSVIWEKKKVESDEEKNKFLAARE